MNEFLNALKEDLTDRRLLPYIVVAAVALIAAIAFAELGGGSSSSSATLAPHAPAGVEAGALALTTVHGSNALAETTSGSAQQRQGASRNPFTLLPGAVAPGSEAGKPSSGGSGSKGSGSESSSGSGKPSESSTPSTGSGSSGTGKEPSSGSKSGSSGGHSQPPKAKTVYQVSVLFGEPPAPSGSPASELKPYENLKLLTPLPSSKEPLLVFRGVSDKGKLATFTVAGETILHGEGKCLPSAFQCQAIQLRAGKSEQVQYLPPDSQTVQSYELRLVSITPIEASAAKVASLWHAQSHAGMQVLRRANLLEIPGLSVTALAGVLVSAA